MHFIIILTNDLLPRLNFSTPAAFEYLSDYDHFIVSKTLKNLQDMGQPEMPQAKREEHELATSSFYEFQVK